MKLNRGEHLIWTDEIDLKDWEDYFDDEYPEVTDEYERYSLACDLNAEYLEDERANLNIRLDDAILCIADLGLWYGRRSGYKVLKSGMISDCLYSDCDYNTWWVDKNKDLRCKATHHDGTNFYLYRVFKHDASQTRRENLMLKLYNGTATRRDITNITSPLGVRIAQVYGW